jgi:hypothetical protein
MAYDRDAHKRLKRYELEDQIRDGQKPWLIVRTLDTEPTVRAFERFMQIVMATEVGAQLKIYGCPPRT